MGVVFPARDVSLDRSVAIKLLSTDLGGRIEARERFLREARTSAGLSETIKDLTPVRPSQVIEDARDFPWRLGGHR